MERRFHAKKARRAMRRMATTEPTAIPAIAPTDRPLPPDPVPPPPPPPPVVVAVTVEVTLAAEKAVKVVVAV